MGEPANACLSTANIQRWPWGGLNCLEMRQAQMQIQGSQNNDNLYPITTFSIFVCASKNTAKKHSKCFKLLKILLWKDQSSGAKPQRHQSKLQVLFHRAFLPFSKLLQVSHWPKLA